MIMFYYDFKFCIIFIRVKDIGFYLYEVDKIFIYIWLLFKLYFYLKYLEI